MLWLQKQLIKPLVHFNSSPPWLLLPPKTLPKTYPFQIPKIMSSYLYCEGFGGQNPHCTHTKMKKISYPVNIKLCSMLETIVSFVENFHLIMTMCFHRHLLLFRLYQRTELLLGSAHLVPSICIHHYEGIKVKFTFGHFNIYSTRNGHLLANNFLWPRQSQTLRIVLWWGAGVGERPEEDDICTELLNFLGTVIATLCPQPQTKPEIKKCNI